MKTIKLSFVLLATACLFASCQKEDFRPSNAVNISLSVGALTKSNALASDDSQKQFNAGDQVSVSATGQDAVIYQLQADGETWRETVANKFLLWNASQLEFQAYYPVTEGTSMTAFTLPTDQSSEAKINAADYMTATQTISRPDGGSDIALELQRQTARVIVIITGFGNEYYEWYGYGDNVPTLRINSAAAAIADGAATGSVTTVTPFGRQNGDDEWYIGCSFTALVIPAAANATADFITLTDGLGHNLSVKGIPAMEAGKSYNYNLHVGKDLIQISSVTVTDWTTGETLAGGQAEEATGPTTVLSGALVDGAIIKVNFKWRGNNAGDYVQGVYNAASGTFTASKGGDYWGSDGRAVYKVEKSGDNIIIGAGFYDYSNEAMVWTFNTTNDTYTTTNGNIVNAQPGQFGLISVTLNGTDITSQLTAQ